MAFAIWSELARRLGSTVATITMGWNDAFSEAACAAQVSSASSLTSIMADCENAEEPLSDSEKEEENRGKDAPARPLMNLHGSAIRDRMVMISDVVNLPHLKVVFQMVSSSQLVSQVLVDG